MNTESCPKNEKSEWFGGDWEVSDIEGEDATEY